MKKIHILLLIFSTMQALGGHLVGGTIQVKQSPNSFQQYEFIITLYSERGAEPSLLEEVPVCFGDGTIGKARRYDHQPLEKNPTVFVNLYRTTHTYIGNVTRTASVSISGRSNSRNVPALLETPFYIETTINTAVLNNTPAFPVSSDGFLAIVNQAAIFQLRATDLENDSLVYYLIRNQTGECEKPKFFVMGATFPNDVTHQGTFKIVPTTGELSWNAPTEQGRYAFTAVVEEWRKTSDGMPVRLSRTTYEMASLVENKNVPAGIIPPYEAVQEKNALTSIENEVTDGDVSISIYPVPTNDRFQVILKSAKPTAVTFQLYDKQGRLINEIDLTKLRLEHEQTLETSQLTPGTYLLRTYAQDRLYTSKIVKR